MEDFIWSTEWDGALRKLFPRHCYVCDSIKYIPKHIYNRWKYCSVKCRGKSSQNRIATICSFCNKKIEKQRSKLVGSKSGHFFCNRKCKEAAQSIEGGLTDIQPSHFGTGGLKYNYRSRTLEAKGAKCSKCNYSKEIKMLDVDHIDGDRENNTLDNLQVLCVWCHAIKTRGVHWHSRNSVDVTQLGEC